VEYLAMYTYESSEQGDLSFQQGDIVMVTRKEGDWWTGTVGGKTGVFPSNYVKPRDSAMEVRALFFLQWSGLDQKLTVFPFLSSVSGTCRQDRKSREEVGDHCFMCFRALGFSLTSRCVLTLCLSAAVCQVIGMYDYVAQNDDELAFLKGQVITVLNKEDCDWWKGELNGREGLFPSNYLPVWHATLQYRFCLL
uniref:Osteoclast-stimulating factor 1 n=1 Tax=Oryzias latipes TaxID=8090 RepID=A0A3B3IJF9_ORYLA